MEVNMPVEVNKLTEDELRRMGVFGWPVWTKEISEFGWNYDEKESCFILEGDVDIITNDGSVHFGKGDFVVFPKGLSCTWKINKAVKKHYKFG
jgi:hypothetical protein